MGLDLVGKGAEYSGEVRQQLGSTVERSKHNREELEVEALLARSRAPCSGTAV